jgi:hypothetical protein
MNKRVLYTIESISVIVASLLVANFYSHIGDRRHVPGLPVSPAVQQLVAGSGVTLSPTSGTGVVKIINGTTNGSFSSPPTATPQSTGSGNPLGIGASASITAGGNVSGIVRVQAGSSGLGTWSCGTEPPIILITFGSVLASIPSAITLTPASAGAANRQLAAGVYCFVDQSNTTTSSFTVSCDCTATTGSFPTSFIAFFYYHVDL